MTEAIILAGGKGSRLQSVVSDLPKPMAPVQGRPFLEWQLINLQRQGFRRVVISVCHLAEKIVEHFGPHYGEMELEYAWEREPLGTGGGIRLALEKINASSCVILNGDSFFDVDLQAMRIRHRESNALLTIALKAVADCQRYGAVVVEDERVIAFREKSNILGGGLMNCGIYFARLPLFSGFDLPPQFSFEREFLTPFCRLGSFHSFIADGFFIDIGVPDDYLRAQSASPFQTLLRI